MKLTETDISRAHETAGELAALLALFDANDHELEKAQIGEQIASLIRAAPDNAVLNLAATILDQKIQALEIVFIDATALFYDDGNHVAQAYQTSDLFGKLRRAQNALAESPSPELARQLQSIFEEFSAANPLPPPAETPEQTLPGQSGENATADELATPHLTDPPTA